MPFKWVALARNHRKKNHRPAGRPAKTGFWKVCRENGSYKAVNTTTGAEVKTICEGNVFWLEKSTPGDCPNYVALELREMNEKLGLIFYLDKVRLHGRTKPEYEN